MSDYRLQQEQKRKQSGCVLILLWLMATIMLVAVFGSCAPRVLPEPRTNVVHDTTYINTHSRDSIYIHDSVWYETRLKGDTIIQTRDRWHTQYIEIVKTDTFVQHKCDTLTNVVAVEKELTRLQKSQMWLGSAMMWLAAVGILVFVMFWWIDHFKDCKMK